MAYKDEYEVARLSLDPSVADNVREEFGPDARYAMMLHPPVLKALGVKREHRPGALSPTSFRVLRSMRKLRGTPFDPFGRTRVRKTEQERHSLRSTAPSSMAPWRISALPPSTPRWPWPACPMGSAATRTSTRLSKSSAARPPGAHRANRCREPGVVPVVGLVAVTPPDRMASRAARRHDRSVRRRRRSGS